MKRVLLLGALVLIATPLLAADLDHDLSGPEAFRPATAKHRLAEAAAERARLATAKALAKSWAPELAPSPIDVLRYDLDLALDFDRYQLSGTATIDLAAVDDGLGVVTLDMDLGLRPLSVVLLGDPAYPHDGPQPLAWQHADDRLAITLPRALAAGENVTLQIAYGGHGSRYGYGVVWQSYGGNPLAWSFAEPFGARIWFPCNDRPDDKALVTIRTTAPDWATVASNGRETGRLDNGDGTATTTWSSSYPVSTYLVVLNVGEFEVQEHTYHSLSGTTMPVLTFVLPFAADQAAIDLANTPDMIATLAGHYGEYPFLAEKYGNTTTFFGGGMEHQTLTTYSVDALGTDWAPWLNVHELAHQWWGDWITCPDWRELWLNEGFATFSEWLWAEHLGPSVLQQYLVDSDYLGWFRGALYDNPVAFSSTVYDKGAWVLRMLRQVVGDDHFFAALARYRGAHGGAGASSDELRAAFEAETGDDLGWFFQQWVYGANRPRLQYTWEAVAGPGIRFRIDQEHTNAPPFRLPIEVDVTTTAGVERHRIDIPAARSAEISIAPLAGTPTAVAFDPDNWVLAEISPAAEPDLDLGPDFPGPYDGGVLRSGQDATLRIPLTNTGGSTLEIDTLTANQGAAWSVVSPIAPFTVAAGETVEAELRFNPRGQGDQDDYLVIFSNVSAHDGRVLAPLTGRGALAAGPRLATQTGMNLGSVPVGGIAERTLPVKNLGDEPLTLAVTLEGDGFALASPVPPAVGPTQDSDLYVRFQPTAVGDHTGTLRVMTNDPVRPEVVVSLRGAGADAPRVVISPVALHLGLGPQPGPAAVTVTNAGGADLTVSAVELDGPFELVDPFSPVVVLPPAASLELPVRVAAGATGELRGTLRVLTDDPSLAWSQAPLSALVTAAPPALASVPAAANTAGVGGARWTTTATFLNPSDTEVALDLGFRPDAAHAGAPGALQLTIPPASQRRLDDVVGVLGETGAGGLALACDRPDLITSTRTFSSEAAGSYGQHIGAVAAADLIGTGDVAVLAGLAGNGGFHTNVGILNLGDGTVTVRFTFHASDGSELGELPLTAAAGGYAQDVAVIAALTGTAVRGGYALVTTDDAGASYTAWASVVDDVSHDPTFVAPIVAPSTDLVVAAAAATGGLSGTVWRSALTLVNPGPSELEASIVYHPAGGGTGITYLHTFTLAAGTAAFYDSIVEVVGASGVGWLSIESTGDGVYASSRTYTTADGGTYGQLIPAVPATTAAVTGEVVAIPGLREDAEFRTNLGLTSLATTDITVTARFFGDTGALIGELPIALPAGAFVQEVRVLAERLGYSGTAWVELVSDDAGSAFIAHASVVDGASGDPAYIPAMPVVQ